MSAVMIHATLHNWNGKVKQTAGQARKMQAPISPPANQLSVQINPVTCQKSEETALLDTVGSHFWGLNSKGDTLGDLILNFSGSCVTQLTGRSIQRDCSLGCTLFPMPAKTA